MALVALAATTTVAGTVAAAVLLLLRLTVSPPAGADEVSVSVAVEVEPPATVAGESESAFSAGGLTVRAAPLLEPLSVAVTVALVTAPTASVETVKVPLVAPAGIESEAGTVAAALSLLRATVTPPVGAASLKVRVAVLEAPPARLAGERVTELTEMVVTVSVVVTVAAPAVAAIVAATVEPTGVVVTAKVAEVLPAGTVAVAGTLAAALSLDSAIAMPAAGAGPVKVTVPVLESPPKTETGATLTPAKTGALTENTAVALEPFALAPMVATVLTATAPVATVKVALVEFAVTLTVPGTVAAGLSLLRATTIPPAGAGAVRVTVAEEDVPPVTGLGFSTRAETASRLTSSVA